MLNNENSSKRTDNFDVNINAIKESTEICEFCNNKEINHLSEPCKSCEFNPFTDEEME
ncbi:unnamed protein product [marine sediment metagenome]|uniref:Uncharacterized protein n=1 Tax=marine sediment metagenome TaxID=412755 RepID=X1HWY4_9ZZZZ